MILVTTKQRPCSFFACTTKHRAQNLRISFCSNVQFLSVCFRLVQIYELPLEPRWWPSRSVGEAMAAFEANHCGTTDVFLQVTFAVMRKTCEVIPGFVYMKFILLCMRFHPEPIFSFVLHICISKDLLLQ